MSNNEIKTIIEISKKRLKKKEKAYKKDFLNLKLYAEVNKLKGFIHAFEFFLDNS